MTLKDETEFIAIINILNNSESFSKDLNQSIQDNKIEGESKMLLETIMRFDLITQAFALEKPEVINSNACNIVMESKQFYANDGMVKIVTSIPFLSQYTAFAIFKRDFWIRRNNKMIDNILRWNELFQPKTIVVLCGFEHKYYLYNSLSKQSKTEGYKVKEYWNF